MASSTAARRSGSLIAPHGGELVNRTVTGDEARALHEQALTMPRVHMSEKQTADLDMIASGALYAVGLLGFAVSTSFLLSMVVLFVSWTWGRFMVESPGPGVAVKATGDRQQRPMNRVVNTLKVGRFGSGVRYNRSDNQAYLTRVTIG